MPKKGQIKKLPTKPTAVSSIEKKPFVRMQHVAGEKLKPKPKHDLTNMSSSDKSDLLWKNPSDQDLVKQLANDGDYSVRAAAYYRAPNDLLSKQLPKENDFAALTSLVENLDHKSLSGVVDKLKNHKSEYYHENHSKWRLFGEVAKRGDPDTLQHLFDVNKDISFGPEVGRMGGHAAEWMGKRADKKIVKQMLGDKKYRDNDDFTDAVIARFSPDELKELGLTVPEDTRRFHPDDLARIETNKKVSKDLIGLADNPKAMQQYFDKTSVSYGAYRKALDVISPQFEGFRQQWDVTAMSNEAGVLKQLASKKGWGDFDYHGGMKKEVFMDRVNNFLPEKDMQDMSKGLDLTSMYSRQELKKQHSYQQGKSLTLYRGTHIRETQQVRPDTFTTKSSVLSSWSESKIVADDFAKSAGAKGKGIVLEAQVPFDDVAFSHYGHISHDETASKEKEVVLKSNSPRKVKVHKV